MFSISPLKAESTNFSNFAVLQIKPTLLTLFQFTQIFRLLLLLRPHVGTTYLKNVKPPRHCEVLKAICRLIFVELAVSYNLSLVT